MYKFLISFLFFFFVNYSFSQTKIERIDSVDIKPYYFIDADLHTGFVINNYVYWDSFPSRYPSALFEFKSGKQTTGDKIWHQHYGFPQVGLSFIGGYLGNTNELGYTIGLVPNITLNATNKKKWSLKVTLGLGFSYFNKPYQSTTNKTNILIGSHITNMSIAQLYFRRSISDKTDFNFGLSSIHASDGHYQLPNVGLNMITMQMGFKYYLNGKPEVFCTDNSFINHAWKLKYGLRLGLGMHEFGNELGPVDGPKYPILDISFYVSKPAGKLGNGLIGMGYKYYSSFYKKIIEDSIYQTNQHLKASVFTLFMGYEFEMGHVSLLAQAGINLYSPFWKKFTQLINEEWTFYKRMEGLISTRLGLQYHFFDPLIYKKNLYLGLYVKANMGGADFVSLNSGFVF